MKSMKPVRVQMLGSFAFSAADARIGDGDNRSKKVWLFLAYLLYHRDQRVEAADYIDLLWEEGEAGSDPANALKTILHRARGMLDQLWPGAGHDLILRQGSAYLWNPDCPTTLDVSEFDRLCLKGKTAPSEEKRLKYYMEALELYRGNFLSRFSSFPWVMPIAAHYHQSYLWLVFETLPMLRQRGDYRRMEEVCRAAMSHDAYTEELYYQLMDALMRQDQRQEVAVVYEDMIRMLMDNFGVMPSDKVRELYREALSDLGDRSMPIDSILEQLREPEGERGAMVCPYDVFRSIYHSVARSLVRSGDVVHLALISVHSREQGKALPKRSLERAMDNLQEIIRGSLRRGDVAARCSTSQFVVMLPQANFENSQMVCQRILRAFNRQYPHSPVSIQPTVHALEPN